MYNNNQATVLYRKLVTAMVRPFLFQGAFTLKQLSELLHLTPAQMSRVYHGVCSLSPEKYVFLRSMFVSRFTEHFEEPMIKAVYCYLIELENYFKEVSHD